jgi:hypothetical protein
MSCKETGDHSVSCSQKRPWYASWLPASLIAILPKCPFCIMAYSGAIPLCSGSAVYPNDGNLPFILSMVFAAMVLFGILLNRKGQRTAVATIIAVVGIILLAISQTVLPSMTMYYISVFTMFFGIWYNGSFSYFFKKIKVQLQSIAFSSKTEIHDDSRSI